MKILIDATNESQEQDLPMYKNFKIGRVCVGGKFFIIKMKERSPEEICDIHQKWDARKQRRKLKQEIQNFAAATVNKRI